MGTVNIKQAKSELLKNLFRKTAPADRPYAVYEDPRTGWRWEVLHTWKHATSEDKAPYAKWFSKVKSPIVPEGEMGDVYRNKILADAVLVDATTEWRAEYGL